MNQQLDGWTNLNTYNSEVSPVNDYKPYINSEVSPFSALDFTTGLVTADLVRTEEGVCLHFKTFNSLR